MFFTILCTLLIIAISLTVFQNKIGRNGATISILFFNTIFVLIGIFNFFYLIKNILYVVYFFQWIPLINTACLGFLFNFYSIVFCILILLITFCVLLFSVSYMYSDLRIIYFFSLIEFFMFFMLLLVSSSNILCMFIGWEGVGIISFLLINFWFNRISSNKSALKALIFNRIGDAGYFVFICYIMALSSGNLNFLQLPYLYTLNTFFFTFLIFAICGKSAQLVLYAWLPDAMEGPTPVSSLLHSATMVTAGIFLFIRTFDLFFFDVNSFYLVYMMISIGLFTGILSGLFAIKKYDIKKIIAFSTCSQLGLMVCGIGLGLINESFFYLYTHAFFKCLLFVTSGLIIHLMFEEQDIRKMISSFSYIPIFYICFTCGFFSMCGLFFFSGYYAKELLLVGSVLNNTSLKISILFISLFTIVYSVRLLSFLFGYENMSISRTFFSYNQIINIDHFHISSLLILFIGSISFGFYFGDSFLNYEIFYHNYNSILFELIYPSILFSSFFFLLYTFLIYIHIFKKTHFISLLTHKIIFVCHKLIMIEFLFPLLYWFISININFIIYKYILLCYDRLFLDSLSIFSFFSKLRSIYSSYNKKDSIDLSSTLILLFNSFSVFIIMIFISLQITTFLFISSLILMDFFAYLFINFKKKKMLLFTNFNDDYIFINNYKNSYEENWSDADLAKDFLRDLNRDMERDSERDLARDLARDVYVDSNKDLQKEILLYSNIENWDWISQWHKYWTENWELQWKNHAKQYLNIEMDRNRNYMIDYFRDLKRDFNRDLYRDLKRDYRVYLKKDINTNLFKQLINNALDKNKNKNEI